jgi:hypothetical protein
VVGAGAVLACSLLAAIGPQAASAGKPKVVFFKVRVSSDHIVVPGQLETISISRMPPRTSLKVFIEPPPITPQCGDLYFCDPAPTAPAPGAPPYRTNGKGRALLTFVMPSTYWIQRDPFLPGDRREVTFAHGQAVHIDVLGAKRRKRARLEGFGFSRAVVQLPPAP